MTEINFEEMSKLYQYHLLMEKAEGMAIGYFLREINDISIESGEIRLNCRVGADLRSAPTARLHYAINHVFGYRYSPRLSSNPLPRPLPYQFAHLLFSRIGQDISADILARVADIRFQDGNLELTLREGSDLQEIEPFLANIMHAAKEILPGDYDVVLTEESSSGENGSYFTGVWNYLLTSIHNSDFNGFAKDEDGWVSIEELVEKSTYPLTRKMILDVVAHRNGNGKIEASADGKAIRIMKNGKPI